MIPLRCSDPGCGSLRISGTYNRPYCRECGTYVSTRSLSRQLSKRRELGTCEKKASGTHNQSSVCRKMSFLHTKLRV